MSIKVITKKIDDGLNRFLDQSQQNQMASMPEQDASKSPKKIIKKQDGLIERVDVGEKIYITEDNRQLLND